MKDYEKLPVSLIWEVMDWYKKSILLAREKEVPVHIFSNEKHFWDKLQVKHLSH